MKPLPWSHTALEDFISCPRAYSEKRVFKSVVEAKSEQMLWGERVHKCFEDRQRDGVVLPDDLEKHEEFMLTLQNMPGETGIERKIALNLKGQPCGFFDKDVWYRGVIDFDKIKGKRGFLLDYKTGKKKAKFNQLKLFALYTFAANPEVEIIGANYYWTTDSTMTGEVYSRDMIPTLWKQFLPDLKQYREAFATETWQPRQSGLCAGWCPVTECEFWRPKRMKR